MYNSISILISKRQICLHHSLFVEVFTLKVNWRQVATYESTGVINYKIPVSNQLLPRFGGCAWLTRIRRVLDWITGFIAPYTFTHFGNTGNYCDIDYIHTSQFTAEHALVFSVFTCRILAKDLSQSHCNLKSHMKSSLHSLIHFLSLFYNCQFRSLYSIQFQLDSILFSTTVLSVMPNTSLQPLYTHHAENTASIVK
jgi:hypothetical protein